MPKILLASNSSIRGQLLENAGVEFEVVAARIDEDTIKQSLLAENATAKDIAAELSHAKSSKVSSKHPDKYVLGCDQTLAFQDGLLTKPKDKNDALNMLQRLSGKSHILHSAVSIFLSGKYQWHHIGSVKLTMHPHEIGFLEKYVDRNWDQIRHCVGCYMMEGEGIQLFSAVEGSYFDVLGLPMIETLSYLRTRGVLPK